MFTTDTVLALIGVVVFVGRGCLVDQIFATLTGGTIHDFDVFLVLVKPSTAGRAIFYRGSESGAQLAVQALVGVVVERFIGGIVQDVLAKWAH